MVTGAIIGDGWLLMVTNTEVVAVFNNSKQQN